MTLLAFRRRPREADHKYAWVLLLELSTSASTSTAGRQRGCRRGRKGGGATA
jgi:hypothetical protein